jgi:hypothetical protein
MRVFAVFTFTTWVAVLGAGCASSGDAEPSSFDNGGSSSVGGQPTTSDEPTSLQFEAIGDLSARAQIALKVRALPAKGYHVRFALPVGGGDPLDAVLDQATVDTDNEGIASVTLTAPSSPTSFNVRASVGGKSALLPITVTDNGVATLQVKPLYAGGLRPITTWIASAYQGITCAELAGIPPEDGPLQSLPAAANSAPQLINVPAGQRLAVTLRSGHFVGGCASVETVPPGSVDKPQLVQVTVLDRPIDLNASPLSVSLGLAVPEATWSHLLDKTTEAVLLALRGTSIDDVDALLDAMRESSGSSRQLFENARTAENWDATLRVAWGASAANKLRDTCASWLAAGRQRFSSSDHLFTGTFTPISQPGSPLDQRSADFTLLTAAGLDGAHSGFVNRAQVSWSASSDDTLLLGTDLYFVASQLLQGLAQASALEAEADVATAAELLSSRLDCPGVGAALAAIGPNAQLGYDACDAECLTELCESGLSAIWQRGSDATGLSPAHLSVTATGTARVGDTAEVVGVSGSWIGALSSDDQTSPTSGVFTGVAPPAQ